VAATAEEIGEIFDIAKIYGKAAQNGESAQLLRKPKAMSGKLEMT
jgi:hypothetical protein